MTRKLSISIRLIAAALLHGAYLWFLYAFLFGAHGKHVVYFPSEPLIVIGATCGAGIVILAPVLRLGDSVQRLIAAALLVLPVCGLLHVGHEIYRVWVG